MGAMLNWAWTRSYVTLYHYLFLVTVLQRKTEHWGQPGSDNLEQFKAFVLSSFLQCILGANVPVVLKAALYG
eukprot:scaffold68622_cov18-Tisochrysis_lutea.AAC.1